MRDYVFVSFKKVDKQYVAFASLEALANPNIEKLLTEISSIYTLSIMSMIKTVKTLQIEKKKNCTMEAATVWDLGNIIFTLIDDLHNFGFEIDNLYDHLTQELDIKRKWLVKVIILRRYLPYKLPILSNHTWSYFEKGTRKKAEAIVLENADLK